MKSHPLAPILVFLVFLLLWVCSSCEEREKLHIGPPPHPGHYLTYIQIEKIIPGDTAYEWRWEVLGYGNNRWNTLHFGDWNIWVSHWTELPEDPDFGLNFDIYFDEPKHHGEPKDSIYGVSYYPTPPFNKCGFWVDNKRHAIYKIAIGDSLYYVTRIKHK